MELDTVLTQGVTYLAALALPLQVAPAGGIVVSGVPFACLVGHDDSLSVIPVSTAARRRRLRERRARPLPDFARGSHDAEKAQRRRGSAVARPAGAAAAGAPGGEHEVPRSGRLSL